MLVDYYQLVAGESERVTLEQYGTTNEDRPLMLATVSTPENLARIEAIRENNLRRAGLLSGDTDPELDNIAIVWLSFSVHGNEAAGSEASMGVLYDLANPDNAETGEWLKNVVVLLDPSDNPDGYNRYTNWYRQMSTSDIDAEPRHPRARRALARRPRQPLPLRPQPRLGLADAEGKPRSASSSTSSGCPTSTPTSTSRGTPPPITSRRPPPPSTSTSPTGREIPDRDRPEPRPYFDQNGWLYFTRERFDLLYPSYGDTYPTFNGAIGMTYEQGGGGRGGRAIDLPTGDTLTLKDRVAHHRTTALSTVEIAAREADRLTAQFGNYFQNTTPNPRGSSRPTSSAPTTARQTAGPDRTCSTATASSTGAPRRTASFRGTDYHTGESVDRETGAGDLIVSAYQPRSVLTQVLFDPSATVEDSVTYDITAWSIPLAYGLETYATTNRLELETEDYTTAAYQNPLAGKDVAAAYAFALPWEGMNSARFLAALVREGIQVRTSETDFTFGETAIFPAGTLIINRGDNRVIPILPERWND